MTEPTIQPTTQPTTEPTTENKKDHLVIAIVIGSIIYIVISFIFTVVVTYDYMKENNIGIAVFSLGFIVTLPAQIIKLIINLIIKSIRSGS